MATIVVVGAQWGDEGKGRVTDFFAEKADMVVRYQGGNNAGHTVEVDQKRYKLHLLPSGIIHKDKISVIGNGVVVDPEALLEEIEYIQKEGLTVDSLRISERAHVIMPYHKVLDAISEENLEENEIGTTKKGIGPCYMDKAERSGIRIADLIDEKAFREKAKKAIRAKNEILVKLYGKEPLDEEEIIQKYTKYGEILKPYVVASTSLIYHAVKDGQNVLFEGAQGTLLDIDFGTYPYVTSSHPIAGGVCVGTGVGPTLIDNVVGVVKAYTTRVGKGPFVTEQDNEIGDTIRIKGHEFGTTTGRPRRCGWLDGVILKYAVMVNGLTYLAVNHLDTLSEFETVKICTGYLLNGKSIYDLPANLEEIEKVEPIYEEMPGWDLESLRKAKTYEELPENAKKYLEKIEEITGIPVCLISFGPERHQAIYRTEIF